MDHDDYYDVLGLDFASSTSDVVKAYKAKALIHHPDKGGMVGTFIRLKAARDTLSDTALRMTYDTKCGMCSTSVQKEPQVVVKKEQSSSGSSTARPEFVNHGCFDVLDSDDEMQIAVTESRAMAARMEREAEGDGIDPMDDLGDDVW